MGNWSLKSIGSVVAAPFTGGSSLLALGDDSGTTAGAGASMLAPTMLLGTASGIGENIYNNYASRKATKAQNEWNLAQWERENAYNHPAEIMKRYQEAGLNPNLIYGQAYESPAHLESAKRDHVPLNMNMVHNVLSMYNLDAQNALLRAQKKEVDARTSLIETQSDNWVHDHANWQREVIDFLRGVFGSTSSDPVAKVGIEEKPWFGFNGLMRRNAHKLYEQGLINKDSLLRIVKRYNY